MAILFAMIIDALIGEPRSIWSRVPHPAVLMGNAIGWLDCWINVAPNQKLKGTISLLMLVLICGLLGVVLSWLPGYWAEAIFGAVLIAQRSLSDHVISVARGLERDLQSGRAAVAMIVGRDTDEMDESDVSRGAVESAAENFSDGVVAPVFWFVIGGLPGLLIYKMVNTCDSMVGYKTEKHSEFGWASARLDDALNWIPARLSAVIIALSAMKLGAAKTIVSDAAKHRSPNAGWPEAAMAVALGVALSGPRKYDGERIHYEWVNEAGAKMLRSEDVRRAVWMLWRAWFLVVVLVGFLALA